MTGTDRLAVFTDWPEGFAAMAALEAATATTDLPPRLVELVKVRASELNGCHYCRRMHREEAGRIGIDEATLDDLATWEDSSRFDPAERAALAVTDALTRPEGHRPGQAPAEMGDELSGRQVTQLAYVVATINAWNRLAIADGFIRR